MKKIKCLLCGNIVSLVHPNYTGYKQPQTFKIYSCQFCNTNFSIPRTNVSSLYDIIYSQGENHPGYDRYWKYAKDIKNSIDPLNYLSKAEPTYFGVVEFLKIKKITNKSKILEVGSGLGYLTYALRKSGYDANAIELSKTAVEYAIQNFGNYYITEDLFEYSKKNKYSFDIIISTEVIEHIENPVPFVNAMMNLLKPNGYIVLTTPNKTFFPKKMIWESSLPPIHLWWFSEDSMKYIAKKLNLTVEFINFKQYFSSKNVLFWNKNYCINMPLPKAILDVDGNIISHGFVNLIDNYKDSLTYTNKIKHIIKRFIKRIPLMKYLHNFMLYLIENKANIYTGDKCHYMCAVFHNSKMDK